MHTHGIINSILYFTESILFIPVLSHTHDRTAAPSAVSASALAAVALSWCWYRRLLGKFVLIWIVIIIYWLSCSHSPSCSVLLSLGPPLLPLLPLGFVADADYHCDCLLSVFIKWICVIFYCDYLFYFLPIILLLVVYASLRTMHKIHDNQIGGAWRCCLRDDTFPGRIGRWRALSRKVEGWDSWRRRLSATGFFQIL